MSMKKENTKVIVDVTQSGSITNLDQQPAVVSTSSNKKKRKDLESTHLVHSPVDQEAIEYIDRELATIITPKEPLYICGCPTSKFKIIAGVLIVILIAVSWTGATQFAKSTYSKTFHAPYFVTWYNTCFMMMIYPFFMVPLMCKKTAWRLRTFLRETASIFGPHGFCLKSLLDYLLKCIIPFCILWLITNYLYMHSLRTLNPGTVVAVFSSSSCFVYILSAIFLKDRFYLLRVIAVCLSIGGIVLMSYSEGFGTASSTGIILVVCAALGSALYQVLFKKVMGDASGAQVALFLTLIGLTNTVLFWPILFLMDYMEWEVIIIKDIPWVNLNGTAVLNMIFNYLVNFGISITFPLFISIGTMIGLPLNAGVDFLFRDKGFDIFKILSVFLIVGGFLFMMIPSHRLARVERKIRCWSNEVSDGDDKMVENRDSENSNVA